MSGTKPNNSIDMPAEAPQIAKIVISNGIMSISRLPNFFVMEPIVASNAPVDVDNPKRSPTININKMISLEAFIPLTINLGISRMLVGFFSTSWNEPSSTIIRPLAGSSTRSNWPDGMMYVRPAEIMTIINIKVNI